MKAITKQPRPKTDVALSSFDRDGIAVVFGASGGIGSALALALNDAGHFNAVLEFSRQTIPAVDMLDEASLEEAVKTAALTGEIRLAIDATGFLHSADQKPEKTWRDLDAHGLMHAFSINTIGPALLMKHLLPKLPRSGKTVFATLSARVGSIGDNHLGGWYAYRASKAALNQLVRTASIELARRAPEALCVALHPGTVSTALSAPFVKSGLDVHEPRDAARHMLTVLNRLTVDDTGGFFDWRGEPVSW